MSNQVDIKVWRNRLLYGSLFGVFFLVGFVKYVFHCLSHFLRP